MTKPPSWVIALESDLDSLFHTEKDGKVDIVADGELLAEVRTKGDSMEVAKSFDKGIDSKVGTAKAGIAVELKDTDSNSEGWQIRGTRYEPLTGKSSRYAKVALTQGNRHDT